MDDDELDFGGHNGGWRQRYPWWRNQTPSWRGYNYGARPVVIAAPLALRSNETPPIAPPTSCPAGYYQLPDGSCAPVAGVAAQSFAAGAVTLGVVGLALFGLAKLVSGGR